MPYVLAGILVFGGVVGLGLSYCFAVFRPMPLARLAVVLGAALGGPLGSYGGGWVGQEIGYTYTCMPMWQPLLGLVIGVPVGAVAGGLLAVGVVACGAAAARRRRQRGQEGDCRPRAFSAEPKEADSALWGR